MLVVRNIIRNKTRSLLTILGIAIGIAVYVSLHSFSGSLKGQIQDLIISNKVDVIVRAKGASSALSSRIAKTDYKTLHEMPGVDHIDPLILGAISLPQNPYFLILGTSSAKYLKSKLGLIKGSIETPHRHQLLVGHLAAKKLDLTVTSKIIFPDNNFYTVIGIYSTGNQIVDNSAIVNIEAARHILAKNEDINVALINLAPGEKQTDFIQGLSKQLTSLEAIPGGEYVNQIKIFQIADVFSKGVSFIALCICVVTIVNTMLISVTERTREMGILLAIGWSKGKLICTIVGEALLMCILGAIIGNALGWGVLWMFHISGMSGLEWAPSSLQLKVVTKSLFLASGLALLSAFYPAYVASNLSPAQAIRYE